MSPASQPNAETYRFRNAIVIEGELAAPGETY